MADIFHRFQEASFAYLDVGGPAKPATSLLSQLLSKGTTDKKFVQDAVSDALAELPALPAHV